MKNRPSLIEVVFLGFLICIVTIGIINLPSRNSQHVLVFWWTFVGGDSSIHTSVYMNTFSSLNTCTNFGEKWLQERRSTDLQQRKAYTCESGNTDYIEPKKSPEG